MEELLEFDCVIYLNNTKENQEAEKLRDMGINVPEEDGTKEEKIVKYSFNAKNIVEVRETFVEYQNEWQPAVCVMFGALDRVMTETPPLLTTYGEFKRRLNEYNKESTKTK